MNQTYDNVNFDRSETTKREVHPAGIVKAVCVDIVNLPQQSNKFYDPKKEGSQQFVDQVKLVWETAKIKTTGKHFTISKTFSKSLYDGSSGGNQSGLFKILSSWFGPEYNGRFEASRIAGRPALLVILHAMKDGVTKAKIDSVLPDDTGTPYLPDGSYKRFVPKEQQEEETPF